MKKIFAICILLQIPTLGLFALDIPSDLLATMRSYIGKNVSELPSGAKKAGNSEYAIVVQHIDNPPSIVGLGFSVGNDHVTDAVYQFLSPSIQEIDDIHSRLLKIMEPYGQPQRSDDVLYWDIEKRYRVVISRQAGQGANAVSIKMAGVLN